MENFLNEQTVKIIDKKFFHFLNYLLPGIFVMELFFKKGLFSKIPESLYEFLIYLLWCFLFSVPYNLFRSFSLVNLMEKMKKEALKESGIDKDKFIIDFNKMLEDQKEENEKFDSMFEFFYIMIYLILTFLIYKILIYNFIYSSFLNINIKIIVYVNTLFIFYLIYFILIRPITNLIETYIAKTR